MNRYEIRSSAIVSGAVLRHRYRLDSEVGRGGMGIGCQSPRFKREAVRLAALLQS